ncbi:hypothetical protein [Streptomyces vinaceus]|uniref:hypothetical protein n=1 Tax=Streptomyces vinaceus TaxID=1960 RepID=UPI003699801E
MDQGMAAVAAGIVGLLGAGIGGLATAYGARVGAQQTVEAARTQVDRQAAAEHLHWVREQRRQTYSDIMEADLVLTMTLQDCTSDLLRRSGLPGETVDRMQRELMILATTVTRAGMWGPDDLVTKAQDLIRSRGEDVGYTMAWSCAIASGIETAIQAVEHGTHERQPSRAHSDFTLAVRQTLAAPANQDHGPAAAQ